MRKLSSYRQEVNQPSEASTFSVLCRAFHPRPTRTQRPSR